MRTGFKFTLRGIEFGTLEVEGEWSDHYTTEAPIFCKPFTIFVQLVDKIKDFRVRLYTKSEKRYALDSAFQNFLNIFSNLPRSKPLADRPMHYVNSLHEVLYCGVSAQRTMGWLQYFM